MSYNEHSDPPVIFWGGYINEDGGKTRQTFYRNATCFSVIVDRKDIQGTPFEEEWSKYCIERGATFANFGSLGDCTIAHILPTLERLAPANGRQWVTIEDYLSTPTYTLRLVKDQATADAVATLVEPENPDKPPYWMEPQPFSKLDVPADLPHIAAADLVVLGRGQNYRVPPKLVRIQSTGQVATFFAAEGEATYMLANGEEGVTLNRSLRAMARLLELHKIKDLTSLTRALAVVTTESASDQELKIAGILHTRLPENFITLENMDESVIRRAITEGRTTIWEFNVSSMLQTLHSHGLVHTRIDPEHISVDPNASTNDVWLDVPIDIWDFEGEAPRSTADWEGLKFTFGEWMEEKRGQKEKPSARI